MSDNSPPPPPHHFYPPAHAYPPPLPAALTGQGQSVLISRRTTDPLSVAGGRAGLAWQTELTAAMSCSGLVVVWLVAIIVSNSVHLTTLKLWHYMGRRLCFHVRKDLVSRPVGKRETLQSLSVLAQYGWEIKSTFLLLLAIRIELRNLSPC
ncbi:hypothetical protein ACOMHN_053930 [Nucella lapillus]